MFSKNNLKYIAILALGFFWCSSLYLTQEQYLTQYADANYINIAELLFGSLSMALGILTYGILHKKNKNVKIIYTLFMILSIVAMLSFFATKSANLMSVCLCLTCFLGTAGFGAGYHFSLLANNVSKEYRGRVFAIGYGLGCIGTYLIVLLPEHFYSSINALQIYIPALLINLFLVLKYTNVSDIKEESKSNGFNSYFLKLSIIVLSMALLSALSTDTIALHTINISGGYGRTRLYYCLGLLVAGILADKNKNIFDLCTLASFIFSLLAIVLLKDGYSIKLIAGLSYSFVAFFVVFRTIVFVKLIDKRKNLCWAAAFGLMYSRVIEGLLVLFEDYLIAHYTLLIVVISIVLSIVIVLFFILYFQNSKINNTDVVKELSIKYKLGIQEEKVLNLLVQDLSNQEIADKLFVSVYTIKNHVANIYKKTGMKKKELKEKCFYGTN